MTNFTHENTNSEQNKGQNTVLATLLSFREIKPRVLWQEANKGRLIERIRLEERAERKLNAKPSYFIKQMSWFAKPVAVSLAVFGFAGGAAFGTQAISPLSAFYPAKVFVANAYYKVLPTDKQIEYRLGLANEKLTALKTLQSETKNQKTRQISYLTNSLTSDLYFTATNMKQMKDLKKLATISPKVEAATKKWANETSTNPKMDEIVKNVKQEILTVIIDNEEKTDNCPAYLTQRITELSDPTKLSIYAPDNKATVIGLLTDAKKAMKSNDCLKSLQLLDQVAEYQLQLLISPTNLETK